MSNENGRSAEANGQDDPKERRAGDSVIPRIAAEDDPRAWGDTVEDRDRWLREQRPPHWN